MFLTKKGQIMIINLDLNIEKPRYYTVSDITFAQVDAWFGHTTRDLKLDLIYPQSRMKKVPCIVTRPPKVRPKKSNFGGRYFYVKIQL